jgi:exopolyphosphatase/guanosine-5'-triphosphate,3'-diphosphate pyrophosphatase
VRLGVLDVGSNTVHLLVVDAHPGAPPLAYSSHKTELRLAELLTDGGELSEQGSDQLLLAVERARAEADVADADDLVAFATSAVREATNGAQVLARLRERTGVDLQVLPGEDEARLTFLAVRRWVGWSAGRLLVLDIGGGSLEIAAGTEEEPGLALSLPLGAGRLTRGWLPRHPPAQDELGQLTEHVRAELSAAVPAIRAQGQFDHVMATSKTFRSLARITGAAASAKGPYVRRPLRRRDLAAVLPRIAVMTPEQRGGLPGVSLARAPQLLAGAVVALEAMTLLDVAELEVCPWALREGVILRRLDWLTSEGAFIPGPHRHEG